MQPKNIYFVGICGVAMGSLAAILKEKGFNVKGADLNVYPPMSDKLADWGISIDSEFAIDNVQNIDLVIIGNSISRGNVIVEYVLNNNIPYMSMTAALHAFCLQDKRVIAVAGTHGKTTTTSLIAHILTEAGKDPSYFIGGVPLNSKTNFHLGKSDLFVIEGDEYDSAFFEKYPKFINYRPTELVLTSLEFDHADIYDSFAEIKKWFRHLVNLLPSSGCLVYNNKYESLLEVTQKSFAKDICFGNDLLCNYLVKNENLNKTELEIKLDCGVTIDVKTCLKGDFNYQNITSAVLLCEQLGVDLPVLAKAVESFKGVARRQQFLLNQENVKIVEDFAHHPTAIADIIKMLKNVYSDHELFAIYEPRSATSRRAVFQDELPIAFLEADRIFIKNPYDLSKIPEKERLDISKVMNDLFLKGKEASLYLDVDDIVDDIVDISSNKKVVILIMSNGGFDGIYKKMVRAFQV